MVAQPPDLPAYEEIIASLASKLEGLSTVHSGLGDAAEYPILAHSEMGETKRRIELLASSTQAMVEEIQHLRPVELTATIDAGMASLTRETTESLGALSDRVAVVANEVVDTRSHAKLAFDSLERHLVVQNEELARNLEEMEQALADAFASARTALLQSLVETQQQAQRSMSEIHDVVMLNRDGQASISQVVAGMADQQGQIAHRQEELFPLLTEIDRRQTGLVQQLIAIGGAVDGVQQSIDINQSTLSAVRRTLDATAPAVETSVRTAQRETAIELARSKRLQWISLVLVLGAIVLAWSSVMGLIPVP
jgi:hypothetical protein